MPKVFLVMNNPSKCGVCDICQGVSADGFHICSIKDENGNEQSWEDGNYSKPDWCPLKDVPNKAVGFGTDNEYIMGRKDGWNNCIDKILCDIL